ncbi:MAG: lipocalin-like domain-containing protein [Muribaculaceae bacterium]|nr:lipocalin-like domain-containing protein [Muribaculaceae bacterium]
MKKAIFDRFFSLLAVVMLMVMTSAIVSSCSKNNSMGPLRGQWQILSITYPDGKSVEPSQPRLYISFDQNLLQLTSSDDLEGFNSRYIGQVTGESPDLTFSFPAYTGRDKLDIISRWGIESDPAVVKVENISGNSMTLKVGTNILSLRKF